MSTQGNKLSRQLAVAAALMMAGTGAALAASANADATATIVTPIAISKTSDLLFGNIAAGTSTGTMTVSTADVATPAGGITVPTGNAGTRAAAVFAVTGEGAYTYAITLPTTDQTITSGANTMVVNTFVSNPSGTGALTAGAQTLKVGATLNVGVSQAAGSYSGAFTVTVAYN